MAIEMTNERTTKQVATKAARLLKMPLHLMGQFGKDIKAVAASCLTQAPDKQWVRLKPKCNTTGCAESDAIMSDHSLMRQIREAKRDFKAGRFVSGETLRAKRKAPDKGKRKR